MTQVFDAYSRYYDLLYSDKDYAAEARYVVDRMRAYSGRVKRIAELGCGTGAHAEVLARDGFYVHGVDLSEGMIAAARARQTRLEAEVSSRLSFECADIRTFRGSGDFDAVVSLFHVVSYQTTSDDMEGVLAAAHSLLAPGGVFLFDFWYGPAVLTQKPEVRVKRLEDDLVRVTRVAEPVMHSNRNVVDVNFTVFVEDKSSGAIAQLQERHPMRYFFLPELQQLAAPRFRFLAASAWMTDRQPEAGDWAGFIVLERNG